MRAIDISQHWFSIFRHLASIALHFVFTATPIVSVVIGWLLLSFIGFLSDGANLVKELQLFLETHMFDGRIGVHGSSIEPFRQYVIPNPTDFLLIHEQLGDIPFRGFLG